MKRKAVPEVRSVSEERGVYNKASKSKTPFLVVDRIDGHAGCKYDMGTTDCRLNVFAVKEINRLMEHSLEVHCKSHSLICHGNEVKKVNLFANSNSGSMYPLRLKDAQILARQIREIIMDPINWQSIFNF